MEREQVSKIEYKDIRVGVLDKVKNWFADLKWLDGTGWFLFALNSLGIVWAVVLFVTTWSAPFLLILGLLVWCLIHHVGGLVQCGKDLHKAQVEYDEAKADWEKAKADLDAHLKKHGL
jgi:hypothetical protein